jgi:DNA-directed RNA polymerase specialized sigma24 family protein
MGVPIPESDVKTAYEGALAYAARFAIPYADGQEQYTDAATDGVMWAIRNCTNADTFLGFCRSAVRKFVKRKWHKLREKRESRPGVEALPEHVADRDTKPVKPINIEELPEDLACIVTFYLVEGYDLREIAMLTGQCFKTVQRKLQRAAALLAEGRIKPARKPGERRLSKG